MLQKALTDQAACLWHTSNIFRIPDQAALATLLCAHSFADQVFFSNSGTEAIECAIKLARKYHVMRGATERIDILGFKGAFHGRSYAAMTAAGNPAYTDGYGPELPGYVHLSLDDVEALEAAASAPTAAAILIEPVQGEGGARALTDGELARLREQCDRNGLLLIYDEIQCGMGRSGKLWAYEHSGNAPDIMTIAKALGGGFPIGACLAKAEVAQAMGVGAHGSTFGGNPLAMAVGKAAFGELSKQETLDNVQKMANYLGQQLHGLKSTYPDLIDDIRGKGLLIGIKLKPSNREFMARARDGGLLIAGGGENCVRLLPPLNLTLEEAQEAMSRLDATLAATRAALQPA